jgi:AsmA protein
MAWRILRTSLIGSAVAVVLLIAFPPTGLLKEQLAVTIGEALGRKVTIGDLRLRVPLKFEKPKLDVEIDALTVSNPEGMADRALFDGQRIKTTVDLFPLLKGRVRMDGLALTSPKIMLEEDAAGLRNWVFGAQPGRSAAPTPETTIPANEISLPATITIDNGSVSYQSALTGSSGAVSALNSVQTIDPVSGAFTSKGQFTAGGEHLTFDAALGDYEAVNAGRATTAVIKVDGKPGTLALDGDLAFAADVEFKGSAVASTPSLGQLAYWAGSDTAPSGEPVRASLDGKVIANSQTMTFSGTDVLVDTTSAAFDGTLDLTGERPKITGAIASEHIDLDRLTKGPRRMGLAPEAPQDDFEPLITPSWQQLLDDLNTLERGPQAAPTAAAASATVASSPGWSEQPLNLKSLGSVDMDVTITAADITYGALDLKQGRMKAGLTNGLLDATLEDLNLGEGKATGTFNVDSRAVPPRGGVQLNLTNVAAEPIVTELTGKPLLSGTSNVVINATASGQNQSQLTSSLDGKAHFQMGKGALRGFDVRRMIFEWWKSWKFDLSMRTGFERLDAQYDIKKGIMQSQPGFSMGGSEVEINSTGSVNVPAKRLNQEIRVKAIPPPTAFPIPVRISGDWAKPSVGIDWGGLFSASPGLGGPLGGPQALAPSPEPPPANVQAAIKRVLDANLPDTQLSPDARQMLQSLLPAVAPAPDPAPAPAGP